MSLAALACNAGDGSGAASSGLESESSSSTTAEGSSEASSSGSESTGGGEGEAGDPCDDDGDCAEGVCAFADENNGQGYCAEPCNPSCPEGFECLPASSSEGEGDYCLPEPVEQCGACRVDADCGGPNDRCLQLAGGKFCLIDCTEDEEVCDETFTCGILEGSDILVGKHCIPSNGLCCLDPDTDQYGEGDECMGPDCDQTNPDIHMGADEICDGEDNDCDMVVDNDPVDCAPPSCDEGILGYFEEPGEICEAGGVCVGTESQVCGLYTCSDGGTMGDQCADACDGEDDLKCVDDAHCDDNACIQDLANGLACDESSDCVSGHCQNGFCCSGGDCCSVVSDCPGFGPPVPVCDDPSSCQGSYPDISCSVNFQCSGGSVGDDSACDSNVLADDCNLNVDLYCNGAVDQPVPSCQLDCAAHPDCDANAFCNPDNDICELKRADGELCGSPEWCISGTCQALACCTVGVTC